MNRLTNFLRRLSTFLVRGANSSRSRGILERIPVREHKLSNQTHMNARVPVTDTLRLATRHPLSRQNSVGGSRGILSRLKQQRRRDLEIGKLLRHESPSRPIWSSLIRHRGKKGVSAFTITVLNQRDRASFDNRMI